MQLFILLRARLRGRNGDAVPALSWVGSALPLLPEEEEAGTMETSVSSSSSVSLAPPRPPRLTDDAARGERREEEEGETEVKESVV